MSNFNYWPHVWHLCGLTDAGKREKIQERVLCFVFIDSLSSYVNLMRQAKKLALCLSRLKELSIAVHKIITQQSPSFLTNLYARKDAQNNVGDNKTA